MNLDNYLLREKIAIIIVPQVLAVDAADNLKYLIVIFIWKSHNQTVYANV